MSLAANMQEAIDPVPLTRESELCQVLTCLPEKFIVDFANGIDVTRDHIRVQKSRSGISARFFDGLSGASAQRQASINASLTDGVEASLRWLGELSGSLAQTNHAVVQVHNRIVDIEKILLPTLIGVSLDTKERLSVLSDDFAQKYKSVDERLKQLDIGQKSSEHLESLFRSWEAGKFNGLSNASRFYVVLEELRWGDFGDCIRMTAQNDSKRCGRLIETLLNRATVRITADAKSELGNRCVFEDWLTMPDKNAKTIVDMDDGVRFLADWASPTSAPFVNAVVDSSRTSNRIPYVLTAERLTRAMTQEVFGGYQYE